MGKRGTLRPSRAAGRCFQTGSGKTYTMEGTTEAPGVNYGAFIIPHTGDK